MADRFPAYDVLAKRGSPSWNEQTRRVVEQRMDTKLHAGVLNDRQMAVLCRLVDCIAPQPPDRPPVNTAALVLETIADDRSVGFRHARLPRLREAWLQGLDAIDAEARMRQDASFVALSRDDAHALLTEMQRGETRASAWQGLPPDLFFSWRVIPDIVSAYYAHPSVWSAMGFGGPASPRGYVRLRTGFRDPWEAVEEKFDGG